MEKPTTCVICPNACDLEAPKCGRGRKMAEAVAAGTWDETKAEEMKKENRKEGGRHHHHEHGHGGHERSEKRRSTEV